MTRCSHAVPESPITISGIGMCLSMSTILAQFQGASTYSREKRPPMLTPNVR